MWTRASSICARAFLGSGLAEPTDKGRWQIDRSAFETLGDMHRNENIRSEMGAAMKRANINRMMQLHGREAPHRKITGRVIGKGLAEDEVTSTRSKQAQKRERARPVSVLWSKSAPQGSARLIGHCWNAPMRSAWTSPSMIRRSTLWSLRQGNLLRRFYQARSTLKSPCTSAGCKRS